MIPTIGLQLVAGPSGPRVEGGTFFFRHRGTLRLTIIAKATFDLVPDGALALRSPVALATRDWFTDGNPAKSLRLASDFVPHKARVDVTLVGTAHAPKHQTAHEVIARLAIVGAGVTIDKQLRVVGDRDASGVPQPVVSVPIVAERAAQSPHNPLGSATPNIVALGTDARSVGHFGPIAPSLPTRRALLRGNPAPNPPTQGAITLYPDDFDWRYFQDAPAEQQIDHLRGDEWVVLEGFHAQRTRFRTQLPSARARALVFESQRAQPAELKLDSLAIDADRMTCSLGFRTSFPVGDEASASAMRVQLALSIGNEAIDWPPPPRTIGSAATVIVDETADSTAADGVDGMTLHDSASDDLARRRTGAPALPFMGKPAREAGARVAATTVLDETQMAALREQVAMPFGGENKLREPARASASVSQVNSEALAALAALPFSSVRAATSADLNPKAPMPAAPRQAITAVPGLEARATPPPFMMPLELPARPAVVTLERSNHAPVAPPVLETLPPPGLETEEPDIDTPDGGARARVMQLLAEQGSLDLLDASGANLSKLDFSGRSLQNAELRGAKLRGCSFVGADLSGAVLRDADLTDAKLDGALLSTAELTGARVDRASFDGAHVEGASFESTNGDHTSFRKIKGSDTMFAGATLPSAVFDEASLGRANFRGAKLDGGSLRGGEFPQADFEAAALEGASLANAKLKGAAFLKAKCRAASFEGADLTEADLKRANLAGANLARANLAGATFERADLTGANLADAKREKADFSKARTTARA